jgi:hypothetical protein
MPHAIQKIMERERRCGRIEHVHTLHVLFSSLLRCVAATVSRFTFTSQLRVKDLPIALSARHKRLIETQQNSRHNKRRQEFALTLH